VPPNETVEKALVRKVCVKKFPQGVQKWAQNLPKCCSEHKNKALFDDFLPLSNDQFLKRDFFDSFNGLRSRSTLWVLALGQAWTMLGSRKNSKPEKCLTAKRAADWASELPANIAQPKRMSARQSPASRARFVGQFLIFQTNVIYLEFKQD
jgi:hypothetical protein